MIASGRSFGAGDEFVSNRPSPSQRKFVSEAVERQIVEVKSRIKDPELAWMFENCYPNTLDTTVHTGKRDGKPETAPFDAGPDEGAATDDDDGDDEEEVEVVVVAVVALPLASSAIRPTTMSTRP